MKDYSKNENMLLKSNPLDLYDLKEQASKGGTKKAFSFVANPKQKKTSQSNGAGKRNSSRKGNTASKKSHSFSMTKKFKGLQKICIKDPVSKLRQHNQTPNNQISAMMSIQPTNSLKNTNNSSMIANKNILHQASYRRKPVKGSKVDARKYYDSEKDKLWQWDMLVNTSLSRGKRSSILDLSGIIPMSGNRTTLLKKNSVNVPNYRSSSKNKFCMSNRANLREMRTSEQNSATANYVKGNPLSFHIQNDSKNDSRCCISAIGMHTHYLNNSIGDSDELIDMTNRNNLKKQMITQKYNSGRFQYSSQEGNPNYSSLSNTDFPDQRQISNRQAKTRMSSYHQRKAKSKTSKGYYKTIEKSDLKASSKSRKRKSAKRTRSKAHEKASETAQTPISRTKFSKTTNEAESINKKRRKETKHSKNISDNPHQVGANLKDLIDSKGAPTLHPSYSPYVSNPSGNRKASHRSKSTNPHVATSQNKNLSCFVNIDLSQLPHDMTQREVVETMIRKHELSGLYSDEDEDTSRYILQNLDERRTCRRSQYKGDKDSVKDAIVIAKDSTSPIDFSRKIILGSKSNSIACKTATLETENAVSNRRKESIKQCLITDDAIAKLQEKLESGLETLHSFDKSKDGSSSKSQEEKKFFLYLNMLEDLATSYPKLKGFLSKLKEGFQSTIRNIVANEIKQKGLIETNRIMQERENFKEEQKKQFADRQLKIEQQEDIIESKNDAIAQLRQENESLQSMLEKHRVNGMRLQDENDQLRMEMDRMRRMEEDIIEKCEMFESTDQDLAVALKELREQEKQKDALKFQKYADAVPKLNMEKVQEIIRLKAEADGMDSY